MRLLLFLAYPALAHLAVVERLPQLEWAAMMALASGVLYTPLRRANWRAWLAWSMVAAACAALAATGGGRLGLYLPSLAVPLAVFVEFAVSLWPGRTPLVTRMAAALHGSLSPELLSYTRAVTWLWTLVIAGLFGVDLWLALAAPTQTWSAYANGYAYLILGLVFAAEYLYRRIRFRKLPQPSLGAYLRSLVSARPGAA